LVSVRTASASIGLGCAGLFGLPRRRDRRMILEAAYDAGVRHFDVAPIYGLGLAEHELGQFVKSYGRDAQVATKFGLSTTALGRVAGVVQGPVRRVLNSSSSMQTKVRASGSSPNAGAVGQVLYRSPDYSVGNAKRSLDRSLRGLGLDTLDCLLVHEPELRPAQVGAELAQFLDDCRAAGMIKTWGFAGNLHHLSDDYLSDDYLSDDYPSGATSPPALTPDVLQYPYDIVSGAGGPAGVGPRAITFGFLSGGLSAVVELLSSDPALRVRCAELVGRDLSARTEVAALLARDAVRQNPSGVVLVSTTKPEHLRQLLGRLEDPGSDEAVEAEAVAEIRARLDRTGGRP
jgi:D-threo-aldose 1-dehydrogenase